MINSDKLAPIVEGYKEYFPKHWENEKYKWEAVKHFQDNWDIDASDFGAMLKASLAKANNLLTSRNCFPSRMIIKFAEQFPEDIKKMFMTLYDESEPLNERITAFKNNSEELRKRFPREVKNHFQEINPISVYLWLRYPDKYYIYKYELFKKCADTLDDTYRPKGNGAVDNVIGGFKMYDEIREALRADDDIRTMLDSVLTDSCYADPELVTATIDFGFYLARYYDEESSIEEDNARAASWLLAWNPKNYDWENEDKEYSLDTMFKTVKSGRGFYVSWRCVSTKIRCGDTVFFVRVGTEPKGIFASGYIIADSFIEDGTRYAEVLITKAIDFRTNEIISQQTLKQHFSDQQWSPQGSGISIKSNAAKWIIENWDNHLEEKNETPVIDVLPSSNSEFLKYFAPLIQAIKELGGSTTRKEAHEKVIELMDITEEELSVTYEKTGASRVLNQIDFARNDLAHEGFISSGTKGVWALTELGMNIDMTMELAGLIHMKWVKINTAKRKGEPIPEIDLSKHYKKKIDRKYTKEDFLKDVFLTESEYDKLHSLILRKKNIILQGAPGVGKTFSAKRLAYSIIGEKNENRICMVQFHQNYSYEDFIMGYRPNDGGGFELQSGVFYNFCIRCKENPDKPYFFIIDEINRGNLSKIFGELLMLIETDKRGEKHKLNLVYGGTAFYIPENLHIIGMMNTADRSLAMIDYALRRRFSFYTMQPAFENADQNGFADYTADIQCKLYHSVIAKIRELNDTIRKDSTLGKGFEIGHSYFAPENKSDINDEWVRGVVEYEIIPLIEEYWFDDDKKVEEWPKALYQALGD